MCGGGTLGASSLSETPKCVAPPKVSWLRWLVSVRFCTFAKMHTNAQKYLKGPAPADLPVAKMRKKADLKVLKKGLNIHKWTYAVTKMRTNAQKYSRGLAPAYLPAAKMQKKVDSVPVWGVRRLRGAQTKSRKGKRRSKTPSGGKKNGSIQT